MLIRAMPSAIWFPHSTPNHADQALQWKHPQPALAVGTERAGPLEVSWAQLRGQAEAFTVTVPWRRSLEAV
jgi:acetoacetyl-CoA synthetase